MTRIRMAAAVALVLLSASACGNATSPTARDDRPAKLVPASGTSDTTHTQPARPDAERIPLDLTRAVVGWRLAPGGTPAEKVLTGTSAVRLARDFNGLRKSALGDVPCPMTTMHSDVTVTFVAPGHTWRADVALCPGILVTRDGQSLPTLVLGHRFLADITTYAGPLPTSGPQRAPGGATPLLAPSTGS